jgi:hypothetical protein
MTDRPDGEHTPPEPHRDAGDDQQGRGEGYPTQGYPTQGYPTQGYPTQGYPTQGYPTQGYPTQGSGYRPPDHPRSTTSLVLGILAVVLCQVLGPVAWWMGKKTLDEIDASNGMVGGRGAAQAGYVLGIVGTVLLGFLVVMVVIYAVFLVAVIGGGLATSG